MDPHPLKLRFPCNCHQCGKHMGRGVNAYYWPATKTIMRLECGEMDFIESLSSVADEQVIAGTGNPYFS